MDHTHITTHITSFKVNEPVFYKSLCSLYVFFGERMILCKIQFEVSMVINNPDITLMTS